MSSFLVSAFKLVIFAAGMGLLAGCAFNSQKESSIPWSRPADWEGQIPGMGTNNSH
jgi:hypothetical protein